MSEKIVQTVGREQLGDFAPEFAYFNDDILLYPPCKERWWTDADLCRRKGILSGVG